MAKNQDIESELRSLVETFVSEISRRVRQATLEATLDSLRQAIEGGGSPRLRSSSARAVAAPGTPGRRGRKPSPASVKAAAELQSYVQGHPGLRLEEIGAALGQDTK